MDVLGTSALIVCIFLIRKVDNRIRITSEIILILSLDIIYKSTAYTYDFYKNISEYNCFD